MTFYRAKWIIPKQYIKGSNDRSSNGGNWKGITMYKTSMIFQEIKRRDEIKTKMKKIEEWKKRKEK